MKKPKPSAKGSRTGGGAREPRRASRPRPDAKAEVIEKAEVAALLAGSPRLRAPSVVARVHELLVRHEGSVPRALEALETSEATRPLARELAFTLEVKTLTGADAALADAFHTLRDEGQIQRPAELARFDADRWRSLLEAGVVSLPHPGQGHGKDELPRAHLDDARATYARALAEQLADAYPMEALRARVARDSDPEAAAVAAFLERAPEFSFGAQPVSRFLKDNPEALRGVRRPERVTRRLQAMQRLFATTSRYDEMQVLLDAGLTSATRISQEGRNTFVERFASGLGSAARAGEVFDAAARVSGAVQALLVGLPGDQKIRLHMVLREPEIPEWETLFGPLDLCDCEACCSLLSPAAYLCDVLHFLRLRTLTGFIGTKDALSYLLRRRPDLEYIELSCANTNTQLPYIDLVLELLEAAVAPVIDWTKPLSAADQATLQTTWTAPELAAEPEHVNAAAYVDLGARPYPWTLPFDLWTEKARAYLALLGTTRLEVLERLFPAPPPATLTDLDVAGEHLGLVAAERDIIAGASPFAPHEHWGYAAAVPGTFVADQEAVPVFLRNSGLGYEEALLVLRTRFVNPGGAISVTLGPDCDLAKATIAWPDADALDRVHRFVRLWRKVGLSPGELDDAIADLGGGVLDGPFLVRLSHALRLKTKLGVPLRTVLSWWAPLGTFPSSDGPSLYEQLFQNRAVVGDPTLFVLDATRTELLVVGALNDAAAQAGITAATGLGAGELSLLTDDATAAQRLFLLAADIGDNLLDLANLSHLSRVASLSRALDLQVAELLALRALTGLDPFDLASTTDAVRFAALAETLRRRGLAVGQLDQLLRDNDLGAGTAAPTASAIAAALETLRAALQRALAEKPADPVFDPTGALARQRLVNAVVQGASDAHQLDAAVARHLLTTGLTVPSAPAQAALEAFLDPAFAGAAPLTEATFPDAFTLWRRLAKVATLVEAMSLGAPTIGWLCDFAPANGWLALDALPTTPQASGAALFAAWEPFAETVWLAERLPGGEATVSAFLAEVHEPGATLADVLSHLGERAGWNDADLSFAAGAFGLAFPADYRDGLALRRLVPPFELLRTVAVSASEAFGWTGAAATESGATAIVQAVKARYDAAAWPDVGRRARDGLRVRQRDALVAALLHPGGGAASPWRDESAMFDHFLIDVQMDACQLTSRIKQALSSAQLFVQRCLMRIEAATIPTAAQREDWSALWKWMGHFRVWEANRKVFLFPENWIEPELRDDKTPFFVDLENELLQSALTPESVETAYRHYLEKLDDVARLQILGVFDERTETPTLSLGGTGQAVQELQMRLNDEGALPLLAEDGLFGGATLAAVKAFQTAHGLAPDGVVGVGTWAALAPRIPNVETTHVVGRTRGTPRKFYTRRRLRSGVDTWTPWERVEPEIDVEQVMPLVWHGRRYLFWPVFTELSRTKVPSWQAQMAWSEARDGQWQARRVSADRPATIVAVKPNDGKTVDSASGSVHHQLATRFEGDQLLLGVDVDMTVEAVDKATRAPRWFRFGGPHREPIFDITKSATPAADLTGGTSGDPIRPTNTTQVGNQLQVATLKGPLFLRGTQLLGSSPNGLVTLGKTGNGALLTTPHQDPHFDGQRPFLYQDDDRTFYVTGGDAFRFFSAGLFLFFFTERQYTFETHHHPYTRDFISRLNRGGVPALLQRSMQVGLRRQSFAADYAPVAGRVDPAFPIDDVDFSAGGAYAPYNWEVFFQLPLLIASRLVVEQRFEDAQRWFHYIFDPRDTSGLPAPQCFWLTRPFFEASVAPSIQTLVKLLATPDPSLSPAEKAQKDDLRRQVARWQRDPFNPHLLARLRPVAYQKAVVMKYVDNLIKWGDQLFARDTIEALNEATQLYLLAERILGPRPEKVPPAVGPKVQTFHSIEAAGLDELSNALVQGENLMVGMGLGGVGSPPLPAPPPPLTLAFCVPANDKLLGYWDTIAQRLFNIRNCINLDGTKRQLSLFDQPIDPMLLVRATAAGLDLGSVLNELAAPRPGHRFSVMIERALQLAGEVRSLGASLLSALEKRDAEGTADLHADHDLAALRDLTALKESAITEAGHRLAAMEAGLRLLERRHEYYDTIAPFSAWEIAGLAQAGAAVILDGVSFGLELVAGAEGSVPYHTVGSLGTAGSGDLQTFGGAMKGKATENWARGVRTLAGMLNQTAAMSNNMATYERRNDDWELQRDLAALEITQTKAQLESQKLLISAAVKDLENNRSAIERAQEVRALMRGKFTNHQLYDWMVGQISGLYFQLYQLACDVGRRAERSFRAELGVDSTFVTAGYWTSLTKGLLAGERLHHDLQRMKAAFADRDARELELTKKVSLAALDPMALAKLRQTKECFIELPEAIFDMDHPGHFMRRIKSVSVTIPCVAGPYVGVNATLTLLKSSVRKTNTLLAGKHARDFGISDPRFEDLLGPAQTIATSSGQADSGLFELSFHDERYLPFELAGAISSWHLRLSPLAQLDVATMTDVVLDVRFTARPADALRAQATAEIDAALNAIALADGRKGPAALFSLKHRFASEWTRFVGAVAPGADHVQTFRFGQELFPFYLHGKKIKIGRVQVLALAADGPLGVFDAFLTPAGAIPDAVKDKVALVPNAALGGTLHGVKAYPAGQEKGTGDWTLRLTAADFAAAAPHLRDLQVVVEYTAV